MSAKAAIYLDANAGAPLSAGVRNALVDFLNGGLTGNPSSTHSFGQSLKRRLRHSREQVAASLGASPDEVFFPSSGTEAIQQAIRSTLEPALAAGRKPHWVVSSIEHEATESLKAWALARGVSVSELPVDADGKFAPNALERLVRPETALVSAIWVHNETGVIQDIETLAAFCSDHTIPLSVDAAQAWGKTPIRFNEMPHKPDFAAFSGHKIGALPGTGVLWAKEPERLGPFIAGSQEYGKRGGTENILGILSLGLAATEMDPELYGKRLAPERDRLEQAVLKAIPGSQVYGQNAHRVANTSLFGFGRTPKAPPSEALVAALDLAGFAVSAGSACASGISGPSRTLLAMGASEKEACSRIRVSYCLQDTNAAAIEDMESFLKPIMRLTHGLSYGPGSK